MTLLVGEGATWARIFFEELWRSGERPLYCGLWEVAFGWRPWQRVVASTVHRSRLLVGFKDDRPTHRSPVRQSRMVDVYGR